MYHPQAMQRITNRTPGRAPGAGVFSRVYRAQISTTAVIPSILHCSFQKYIPACQTMWLRFLFGNTVTVTASQCLCHCILGGINRWQVHSVLRNEVGETERGSVSQDRRTMWISVQPWGLHNLPCHSTQSVIGGTWDEEAQVLPKSASLDP